MATGLLRNSSQSLVDRAGKDERYYRDASGDLTRRANQAFTNEAIDGARVNLELHRQYQLQEARQELDNFVEASLTGRMLASPISEPAPKVIVPPVSSAPQRTPGHLAFNLFRPAASKSAVGVTTDLTKGRRPAGPGRSSE